MDNYPIKSVTFGGFDKQDVIHYIEQSAEQAAAEHKKLQDEVSELRSQLENKCEECTSLNAQLASANAQISQLQTDLSAEHSSLQELEGLKPLVAEVAQLKKELESLRPDAEAYAQFREQLGAIECDARKRASDLELAAVNQMQQTLNLFREQYLALMDTFETAANHVTGELRKVEVNLTQLPRTMDQPGTELNELAARLERIKEANAQ